MFKKFHTETCENLDIAVFAEDETLEIDETLKDSVDDGSLLWFRVAVTASKCDIKLAETYMCGCAYTTLSGFLVTLYYAEMRAEVVKHAQEKIRCLAL